MSAIIRRCMALWLALALLSPAAFADTPVTLLQSFAGMVNFTGMQVTARTDRTGCQVAPSATTLSKQLSGIPDGAQVVSARLYWAGSGNTVDDEVIFDGRRVTAQRQYTSGGLLGYFSGAADVTAQVKEKGNGIYRFSGLTVDNGFPYCFFGINVVVSGYSLLVVYTHPDQPFRVLNVYEGFQAMLFSSISLNLGNFKVPTPVGAATGRIGHITWEGDTALNQLGEDLEFGGKRMTDGMNPPGNQFNSQSNVNNDTNSFGIDFDAYTIPPEDLQAGQTSATTVYRSGLDLVFLSAEIVAVPNVPVADLQISMARDGDPFGGQVVTYALTVTNNGPSVEAGPITVTNSLPAGMVFGSATGAGWSCSHNNGKVTCTRLGALDIGQSAPVITITASAPNPGGRAEFTNTASVAGTSFDNNTANNTVTETAENPLPANAPFVFTTGRCAHQQALGTGDCRIFTGPYIAGESKPLYVTLLKNGVPTYEHKNHQRTRVMRFALTCVNPVEDAGAVASVSDVASGLNVRLPACVKNGATPGRNSSAWSGNTSLVFPGGQPSSGPYDFKYPDVGEVRMNMIEVNEDDVVAARFISRPALLRLTVTRQNGEANPGETAGNDRGFVKAGEAFNVRVQALLDDKVNSPPNFGKETNPSAVALGQDVLPAVEGTLAMVAPGTYSAVLSYHEAGYITLTARLRTATDANANNYMGLAVPADTKKVGRFYPAYFKTTVTTGFAPLPLMACPAGAAPATGEQVAPAGAAYSREPFEVRVTAHGLVKAEPLEKYAVGETNQIRLSAVNQPGPDGVATGIPLNGQTIIKNIDAGNPLSAMSYYELPAPDSAPATIYLRAQAAETRDLHPDETISSSRVTPAVSAEEGVQVVSGRLMVGNRAGAELMKMPIKLTAQYWTGCTWRPNIGDSYSVLPLSLEFSNCKGPLCPPEPEVLPGSPASLTLDGGSATFWLKPPGRHGSVDIRMGNPPAWLPSTTGRATFGVARSKVIYMREVY